MNTKIFAVTSVVIERWRQLEVQDVWKIKLRSNLPAKQESVCIRDKLSLAAYGLHLRRARANWVCRIRIVINELAKVCEDIQSQERLRRRRCNCFAIFAE